MAHSYACHKPLVLQIKVFRYSRLIDEINYFNLPKRNDVPEHTLLSHGC